MRKAALLLIIAGACLGPNLGPVLEVARRVDVFTLIAGGVALGLAISRFAGARAERA